MVAELLSSADDRVVMTAKPNHALWSEYKTVGYSPAATAASVDDISRVDFDTVFMSLGLIVVNNNGLFVAKVLPQGDAWADGRIRVGDEIVSFDDQPCESVSDGLS